MRRFRLHAAPGSAFEHDDQLLEPKATKGRPFNRLPIKFALNVAGNARHGGGLRGRQRRWRRSR